jgi:predicted enzyme related to lactoylglutathione lyase
MSDVQVEQKNYRMPPQDGITIAHFITVADIERSAQFYEKIFGGKILSRGDSSGAPGYIQIANTWLIVNVGGGPTPDKPTVTLSIPPDPDAVSSFMNIRVADIHACYDLCAAVAPNSSRSRRTNTARRAATSATRMATS